MRLRNVFSPQEQTRIAQQALKNFTVVWHDVFVVPGMDLLYLLYLYLQKIYIVILLTHLSIFTCCICHGIDYEKFFSGYTSKLARFAKLNWTQLQFTFELKNGDIETSYRAYASNEVVEIFSKAHFKALNGTIGTEELLNHKKYDMIPMQTKVNTYTLPRQTVLSRDVEGNIALPFGIIPPAEFAKERYDSEEKKMYVAINYILPYFLASLPLSLTYVFTSLTYLRIYLIYSISVGPWTQLADVIAKLNRSWGGANPLFERGLKEWHDFRDNHFPKEQDANDYVKANPKLFHVPFAELFSTADAKGLSKEINKENKQKPMDVLLKGQTQPSIRNKVGDSRENVASRMVDENAGYSFQYQDIKEPKREATKWKDLTIPELKHFGFQGLKDKLPSKATKEDMLKLIEERIPEALFPTKEVKSYRELKQEQPIEVKSEAMSYADARVTKLVMANLLGNPKLESKKRAELVQRMEVAYPDFPVKDINDMIIVVKQQNEVDKKRKVEARLQSNAHTMI